MGNIAAYQEGYCDGFDEARTADKNALHNFIVEQTEDNPDKPYLQGYNMALKDLKEFIEEYL